MITHCPTIPTSPPLPMASLWAPLPGKLSFRHINKPNQLISEHANPFLFSCNRTKKKVASLRIYASTKSALSIYTPSFNKTEKFRVDEKNPEAKIDMWMEESVTDIVKNLDRAPLLVHAYNKVDHHGNSKSEFITEKADAGNWPMKKGEWSCGLNKSPDGLIYVKELAHVDEEEDRGNLKDLEGPKKVWGVLVQGRGLGCGPSCYLLKTCRVGSGLGLFCSHFV